MGASGQLASGICARLRECLLSVNYNFFRPFIESVGKRSSIGLLARRAVGWAGGDEEFLRGNVLVKVGFSRLQSMGERKNAFF